MKYCPKCGTTKPLGEFSKAKRRTDGLQHTCKGCARAYRQQNRDRIRERKAARYQENRDVNRENARACHQANRDARIEYNRAYYQANRDTLLEQKHTYYQENIDAIRERDRAYQESNRDSRREKQRSYHQTNTAYWADHNPYLEHPTGRKECRRKHGLLPVSAFPRHALRADGLSNTCRECCNTTGETRSDRAAWAELVRTRPPCIYCGEKSAHVDHVIPVSRGGRDIASNYAPACARCNMSKSGSWAFDWIFGIPAGAPDELKPAAYKTWDAVFIAELFAEAEAEDVA